MSIRTGQPSGRVIIIDRRSMVCLVVDRATLKRVEIDGPSHSCITVDGYGRLEVGRHHVVEIFDSIVEEDADVIWTCTRYVQGDRGLELDWTRVPDRSDS